MIIDFRLRPPYRGFLDLFPLFPAPSGPPDPRHLSPFTIEQPASKVERSMELLIEEMDSAGITQAVVMGRKGGGPTYGAVSNDEIEEVAILYPGRFYKFGGVDLNDVAGAVAEVERIAEMGFLGVALDAGWSEPPRYVDDRELYPIYEKCQELDLILSITSSVFLGPDLTYIEPQRVQHIAADFPKLLIVLPHGGWPYTLAYLGLGLMYNNLWFMPDFYVYLPGIPGSDLYVEAANSYLANRFLFSTSYPGWPLKAAVDRFRQLPLRPDVMEKALYRNARWILEERRQ